jgi:hypothetical protein
MPDNYQIRLFLYGLNPLYIPIVSMTDPGTLDAALNGAKQAESSYQFLTPPPSIPTAAAHTVTTDTTTADALNNLAQQMELLVTSYASATTTNNNNQTNRSRPN